MFNACSPPQHQHGADCRHPPGQEPAQGAPCGLLIGRTGSSCALADGAAAGAWPHVRKHAGCQGRRCVSPPCSVARDAQAGGPPKEYKRVDNEQRPDEVRAPSSPFVAGAAILLWHALPGHAQEPSSRGVPSPPSLPRSAPATPRDSQRVRSPRLLLRWLHARRPSPRSARSATAAPTPPRAASWSASPTTTSGPSRPSTTQSATG